MVYKCGHKDNYFYPKRKTFEQKSMFFDKYSSFFYLLSLLIIIFAPTNA